MEDDEATRRPLTLAEDEGTRRVHNPLNHSGVSDEDVDMLDEGSSESLLDHINYASANVQEFCYLLCSLPSNRAAMLIFYRSARLQLRWNEAGELAQYDIDEHFIPPCVVNLFKGNDDALRKNKDLHMMVKRGLLETSLVGDIAYISVSEKLRASIRASNWFRDPTVSLVQRFGLFNIMLEALPEEYSIIVWEEVQSQLRETIELNCIPILRVMNFEDISRYVELLDGEKSDPTILARYLTMLLRFLRQLLGLYPFLRHLALEILDRSASIENESQLLSEIVEIKLFLEVQEMAQDETPTDASDFLAEKPELLWGIATSGRLNGRFGILIGDNILHKLTRDPSGSIRDSWNFMDSDSPSSLERIAHAYLINTKSIPSELYESQSLTTRILIAFVLSKRNYYEPARDILESALSQVENEYGRESWEYAIATAEYLKCCALTWDESVVRFDSLHALTTGTDNPSNDGSLFLKIALADVLLADSRYEAAIEVLNSLHSVGMHHSSMNVTVATRLSKAHRRLGEVFPSRKITEVLLRGLKDLPQVSKSLQLAFIEELQCNLSTVDIGDFPAYQKLHEAMARSKGMAHPENTFVSDQTENISAQELETAFNEIVSLTTILGAINGRVSIPTPQEEREPSVGMEVTSTKRAGSPLPQRSRRPPFSEGPQDDESLPPPSSSFSSMPSQVQLPSSSTPSVPISNFTSQPPLSITRYSGLSVNIPYTLRGEKEDEDMSPGSSISELLVRPRLAFGPHSKSFLFVVKELGINDDEMEGGVPPREDLGGYWVPPIYTQGLYPPVQAQLYRWTEGGTISAASDCRRYGTAWRSGEMTLLTAYKTVTLFWCNPFVQFRIAMGDASTYDIATSAPPFNRWWPLTFRQDGAISRVDRGKEMLLATEGSAWVTDFELTSHANHNAEKNMGIAGLAGDLAILVGLIAFTCQEKDFDHVLLMDQAWHRYKWRGHARHHGRKDKRGVVVEIFLDPENPQGSTPETLYALEWDEEALVE